MLMHVNNIIANFNKEVHIMTNEAKIGLLQARLTKAIAKGGEMSGVARRLRREIRNLSK
jgi:hypothetical protein